MANLVAFAGRPAIQSAFCDGLRGHSGIPPLTNITPTDLLWLGFPEWFSDLGKILLQHNEDLADKVFRSVSPGLLDSQLQGASLLATSRLLGPSRAPRSNSAPQDLCLVLEHAGASLLHGYAVEWSDFRWHLLRSIPGEANLHHRLLARQLLRDHPKSAVFLNLEGSQVQEGVARTWVAHFCSHIALARTKGTTVRDAGSFARWRAYRCGIQFRAITETWHPHRSSAVLRLLPQSVR